MMAFAKKVLASRTTWIAVVAVLVLSAGNLYGWATQSGRTSPEVLEALERSRSVNIVITLPFVPERFHLDIFQEHGSVGIVRGKTVVLRRVTRDGVQALARKYWISRIALEARRTALDRGAVSFQ